MPIQCHNTVFTPKIYTKTSGPHSLSRSSLVTLTSLDITMAFNGRCAPPTVCMGCIFTSSCALTIPSSLSLSNVICRLRLDAPPPPPPPIVTNPLAGVLYVFLLLLEPSMVGRKGASHVLIRGKVMGRFVVTTAMKVSLVPHEAASCPPWMGSWGKDQRVNSVALSRQRESNY